MSNTERLRSVFSTILLVPPTADIDALSSETVDTWDSLNHINLITALEDEFGITFPTEAMDRLRSAAAIRAALTEQGVVFDA